MAWRECDRHPSAGSVQDNHADQDNDGDDGGDRQDDGQLIRTE
jgi:hypothetical protein